MKKWLLFDLDGTLTDPMIGITSAVKYALSKFGIGVQYLKELTPFIGPPLRDSFMEFYDFSEEDAKKAIAHYREYYGPKGLYENEVYPGIKDMLCHLEQVGFDLAVASSKPTEYVEKILRHFGLREHFVLVVGSEFDGRRIHKADVIDYVLRRAQVRPGEVLMIGDRKHDVIGATSCGVESIGVTYGYGSKEELEEAGATYVVDSVQALHKQILSILMKEREEKETVKVREYRRDEHLQMEAQAFGNPVRLAIVGAGKMAEKFYQANRFHRQMDLIAVYEKRMQEAMEFAARKGRMYYCDDIDELAGFDGIDAVYIACNIKDRYQYTLKMLRAGKHVLVEAPMAESYEEVRDLYQAAEEENVILMEAIPSIYAPAFDKMLPYLASIGKVHHATLHHCHYDMAYEQWKRGIVAETFNPECSGGALMEMGVYPVATMIRLYGAPDHVLASGVKLTNGIDVSGSIVMGYDQMTAQVIYSQVSESAMPSQLQGEDGSMLIGEIDNIKDLKICRRKVDQSIHFEQSDNIMHHETDYFLRMIRTGMGMEECKKISLATMQVLEEAGRQIK